MESIPPGSQPASEVYVRTTNGVLLAKLAFHEVSRNKTDWSNQQLHHPSGGSITTGTIMVNTQISATDRNLMGNHLGHRAQQWTGGCR